MLGHFTAWLAERARRGILSRSPVSVLSWGRTGARSRLGGYGIRCRHRTARAGSSTAGEEARREAHAGKLARPAVEQTGRPAGRVSHRERDALQGAVPRTPRRGSRPGLPRCAAPAGWHRAGPGRRGNPPAPERLAEPRPRKRPQLQRGGPARRLGGGVARHRTAKRPGSPGGVFEGAVGRRRPDRGRP